MSNGILYILTTCGPREAASDARNEEIEFCYMLLSRSIYRHPKVFMLYRQEGIAYLAHDSIISINYTVGKLASVEYPTCETYFELEPSALILLGFQLAIHQCLVSGTPTKSLARHPIQSSLNDAITELDNSNKMVRHC